jgi:Fic family protein
MHHPLQHVTLAFPLLQAAELLQDHARRSIGTSIYFSNLIEDKGMPLPDTQQLVQGVLEGQMAVGDIQRMATGSACAQPGTKGGEADEVATGEHKGNKRPSQTSHQDEDYSDPVHEVLQHAAAHVFLADHMVKQQQPLSEDLILKAHGVLMAGLKREDGVLVNAGQYRTTPAFAGSHAFPPADTVRSSLLDLIHRYNKDSTSDDVDPFVLAAQLSYDFVAIHPFEDGNGRMCRLLLNMALLTHGVPFCSALGFASGRKRAKSHYFQCIRSAQNRNDNTDKLATVVLCAFRDTAVAFFEDLKQKAPEECPAELVA